jgi:hypothetical protein
MIDDSGDDLFDGFWPFMKRVLFMFLPVWVFLLGMSAGAPTIVSSVLAGSSIAVVVFFEKLKLKQAMAANDDAESLIK